MNRTWFCIHRFDRKHPELAVDVAVTQLSDGTLIASLQIDKPLSIIRRAVACLREIGLG